MPEALQGNTQEQLTAILERYVSRITAMSMLANALSQRSLSLHDINPSNIVYIVEEVMIGLRLFCDPARLPDLMLELAEFCDRTTLFSEGRPSQRSSGLYRAVTG